MTPPVPRRFRFTYPPTSPPHGDQHIKKPNQSELVFPSKNEIDFPEFPPINASSASTAPHVAGIISSEPPLQGRSNDIHIMPSTVSGKLQSLVEVPKSLFTATVPELLQNQTAPPLVSSFPTQIYNPLVQTIHMRQESAQSAFGGDRNFRSTMSPPSELPSKTLPEVSTTVPALFINSSLKVDRPSMGSTTMPPISENHPPPVNSQFPSFPPRFGTVQPDFLPPPDGSDGNPAGFVFTTTSPSVKVPPSSPPRARPAGHHKRSGSTKPATNQPRFSRSTQKSTVTPVSFKDALAPPSCDAKKSFEDMHNSTNDLPEPSLLNEIPGILFPEKVISFLSEPFRFALVGKISGNRSLVPNTVISAAFDKLGLARSFDLKFLPRGFLFINLSCDEDFARIWTRGNMFIGPIGIRFSKWTPEFKFEAESSIAPVWVRFPGLPLHLFDKSSLYAIARILGKPVKMDDFTADASRCAFARVFVEIDVLQPLVHQIWIGWGEHTQEIEVIYEKVPDYCIDCKMLGHSTSACYSYVKNPKSATP